MKYLVLAYYDERAFHALVPEEFKASVSQCPPHDAALRESGHLLTIASRAESRASVSVRGRGSKVAVTDKPFIAIVADQQDRAAIMLC